MNKRISYIFFLTIPLCISCRETKKEKEYIADAGASTNTTVALSGNIAHGKGKTLYLEQLTSTAAIPSDSVVLPADGSFHFSLSLTEPLFFRLRLGHTAYFNLILDTLSRQVRIEADTGNFAFGYSIAGSEGSAQLRDLNFFIDRLSDSIRTVYEKLKEEDRIKGGEIIRRLNQEGNEKINRFAENFIHTHGASLASLAAISYVDGEDNPRLYMYLDSVLSAAWPTLSYVRDFHSKVLELTKLAPGQTAPEIVLPDTAGKNIALSAFKGRIVLVDFWASWCIPCRRESPRMTALYQKYHKKGFDIYSVSLDKDKEAWVKAILDDKLHWTHVSELKFWNSSVVPLYAIEAIPFTILLDREGRIIAKGLQGDALEKKLEEVFGK